MKPNTIEIIFDINDNPVIVDACKTDATNTRLSTFDWMIEEYSFENFLEIDLSSGNGIYNLSIEYTGGFENPKEDYRIITKKEEND